jgi:cell wall-associated NlpC family hydrolase
MGFVAISAFATLVALPPKPAFAEQILGTKGADVIEGTAQHDQIDARKGDDRVNGRRGSDRVKGFGGSDRLKGALGRDRLLGGNGADHLNAVDGQKDRAVNGGPGNDVCTIDEPDLSVVKHCNTVKVVNSGGGGVLDHTPTPTTPRTTEAASHAADQLVAMKVPYVLGGGHSTPAVPNPGLDCSSTVSWVLQHAGYNIATASTSTIPTRWHGILEGWDSSQRGVFVVNHPDPDGSRGRSGHVFLVIDGRKFQNTSLDNRGAAWVGPYTITHGTFVGRSHDYVVWHVRGTI